MPKNFHEEVNWLARALRNSLRAAGKPASAYDVAMANLRRDARDSVRSPKGNIPGKSQRLFLAGLNDVRRNLQRPLEFADKLNITLSAHRGKAVGTRRRALIPADALGRSELDGIDRAVGKINFIKFNHGDRAPSALARSLREDPRLPHSGTLRPVGLTGRPPDPMTRIDSATWWRLVSSGDVHPEGNDAQEWARIMALPKSSLHPDGLIVLRLSIADLRPTADMEMFKPNAFSGFGKDSPFLPELTGLPWGLTAGPHPQKEWVCITRSYSDLLRPGVKCRYSYLPWNPRKLP